MNGEKETLSKAQAENIIEAANQIISLCKEKVEAANDEFVNKVSQIWEDKNAVEYMKIHKENFENFIEELGNNNKTFVQTVQDIGNAFLSAGNMGLTIAAAPLVIVPRIDVAKVKEYFENGENSDDFGFINITTGPEEVIEAFNDLKTQLEKLINDAVQQIGKINAFGNHQIVNNLALSAGKMVEILNGHVNTASTQVNEYVSSTALKYKNLGENATTSANLSTEQVQ